MKKKVIIIFLILTTTTACQFFEYTDSATEIIIHSENFILAWDGNDITLNSSSSVICYKVYFKKHNTHTWTFLKDTIDSDITEITISDEILDYGIYDLGVAAQADDNSISEIHSSLDLTADPTNGWYINWIGSK